MLNFNSLSREDVIFIWQMVVLAVVCGNILYDAIDFFISLFFKKLKEVLKPWTSADIEMRK